MRVLICGTREKFLRRPSETRLAVATYVQALHPDVELVVGGADGPDIWAEMDGKRRGLTVTRIDADWEKWGKSAGYRRNEEMLDLEPSLVVAFWDGRSRGTQHTIREAQARGIPTDVVYQ